MRPLFLCCRASGASTKYLYDKTFEMNPNSKPRCSIVVIVVVFCRGCGGRRSFFDHRRGTLPHDDSRSNLRPPFSV